MQQKNKTQSSGPGSSAHPGEGRSMKKGFLEAGKIVGVHGLKGEVKIDPWCDGPGFLSRFKRVFDKDENEMKITRARVQKNIVIVKFSGTDTPEQAQQLRGRIIYIYRKDVRLPEGVYFVQDILGLEAVDQDSAEVYGTVTDVFQTGANDVYQITKDGKDHLIPKIPEVVTKIDTDQGKIYINTKIIGGLFEDEN